MRSAQPFSFEAVVVYSRIAHINGFVCLFFRLSVPHCLPFACVISADVGIASFITSISLFTKVCFFNLAKSVGRIEVDSEVDWGPPKST